MFVTIFLATSALAMVLIGGWQVVKAIRHRKTAAPQFGVKHLLAAMLLIAFASVVVRVALPELNSSNIGTIVVWITQSALLVLFASELLLARRTSFWGLSGLVVGATVLTFSMLWLTGDWEQLAYANAVQVGVLAIAVGLPQLDRYVVKIELQPRERADEIDDEAG
ncbi:MAG: hypothetical protein ACR2NU_00025 [Aeoliella sp.]